MVTTPAWRSRLPTLRGTSVVLRELRLADAASLLDHLARPEVMQHLAPGPTTVDEFRQFIRWSRRERQAGRYVCFGTVPQGESRAVGLFQIWPLEHRFGTAEWGFALGPRYHGTGIFSESARLVIDFTFDVLRVHRLEARAAIGNQRANAALRRLGAVREGVLRECFECDGAYRDHVMWSLLATDRHPHAPGRLRPAGSAPAPAGPVSMRSCQGSAA